MSRMRTTTARGRSKGTSSLLDSKLFCLLNMHRLVFISILTRSLGVDSQRRDAPSLHFSPYSQRKEPLSFFFYFFLRRPSPLTLNVSRIFIPSLTANDSLPVVTLVPVPGAYLDRLYATSVSQAVPRTQLTRKLRDCAACRF